MWFLHVRTCVMLLSAGSFLEGWGFHSFARRYRPGIFLGGGGGVIVAPPRVWANVQHVTATTRHGMGFFNAGVNAQHATATARPEVVQVLDP